MKRDGRAALGIFCAVLAWGAARAQDVGGYPVFDWDLVSLEQNSQRFNASVLSGFHNIRSPGVTPARAWKTGLGLIYSKEDDIATTATGERTFSTQRLIMNPKLNYGFWDRLEAGIGMEANYVTGKEINGLPGGNVIQSESNADVSAADAGLKYEFLKFDRLRLGISGDARAAVNRKEFGMLSASLFNVELDGQYYFTSKFSLVSNLQFMTSDNWSQIRDEVVFDLGAEYTFSDEFRGLVFGTLQEDDPASTVVLYLGFAGQYLFHQRHSFTLAVDFQVNDASREVRTQGQFDLEVSYTFTF